MFQRRRSCSAAQLERKIGREKVRKLLDRPQDPRVKLAVNGDPAKWPNGELHTEPLTQIDKKIHSLELFYKPYPFTPISSFRHSSRLPSIRFIMMKCFTGTV